MSDAKADAKKTESKRVFAPDNPKIEGNPKYKTYDDDRLLGNDAPDLSTIEWLTDAKTYPRPTEGQVIVLFVWAQFQKACYPKVVLYSKLAKAFPKVCVIGLSTDPNASYAQKWLDDPKKKYSTAFETSFSIAWDKGKKVKEFLTMAQRAPVAEPQAFVIKDGKIVWFQQHAELGATAPSYMALMEDQLNLILAGKEVKKVFGNNPNADDDEDEEEEDDGGEFGDF